jgi:hypothetical protein
MTEPTNKSPAVDNMIRATLGINRKQAIKDRKCPLCNGPANEFKDPQSAREATISGMCQTCQDKTFG